MKVKGAQRQRRDMRRRIHDWHRHGQGESAGRGVVGLKRYDWLAE